MTSTDSSSSHDRAVPAAFKLGYHAGLTDAQSRTGGLLDMVSDSGADTGTLFRYHGRLLPNIDSVRARAAPGDRRPEDGQGP